MAASSVTASIAPAAATARLDPDRVRAKICGLTCEEDVATAVAAGAAYVGFVFYAPSPRAVTPEAAAHLADAAPPGVCKVGLFVDPADEFLDAALALAPIDMIQLHGRETPERTLAVRARYGLPVMKAVAIATEDDVPAIAAHEAAADQILCDAKPPPDAVASAGALPGGNGVAFDWRLLAGRRWRRPWMLAGGLTAATVTDAVRLTGARQVDVSSGVEAAPGRKDPERIRAFLAALDRDAAGAGGDGD